MSKTRLLFLIIIIEGYVVLTCELLAIRQLIPFVGSGTEIIAIIISGVLLPLAVGYHFGGTAFRRAHAKAMARNKPRMSIRRILLRNIIVAVAFLSFGTSYLFLENFFYVLRAIHIDNRLAQTAVYTLLFLVTPIFMLGQTVPLTSNYFSRNQLSEITGKMLFFSTVGSFLGSVFSTIVLMSTVGVHNTVIITLALLGILCVLLIGRRAPREIYACFVLIGLVYAMNSDMVLKKIHVVSDDSYNLIRILHEDNDHSTVMNVNRSSASKISDDPEKRFEYVRYIEQTFIDPIATPGGTPRNILIIGAGGFTIGINDSVNTYTYVDIDPKLKDVAEGDFLKQKLGANKTFVADSAREFVHNGKGQYDLIVLDTYTNVVSIPMECTTQEFLKDVKARLKPNGIVVANVISIPTFRDKFSVRYAHTFSSVFPTYTRQVLQPFNGWDSGKPNPDLSDNKNILFMYFNNRYADDNVVYTDDKNTYSMDRE